MYNFQSCVIKEKNTFESLATIPSAGEFVPRFVPCRWCTMNCEPSTGMTFVEPIFLNLATTGDTNCSLQFRLPIGLFVLSLDPPDFSILPRQQWLRLQYSSSEPRKTGRNFLSSNDQYQCTSGVFHRSNLSTWKIKHIWNITAKLACQ